MKMTALTQYQRLDSVGLWRETPQAQRRDVVLSFGESTLIIRDKSEKALAHWSLAAIERINPGKRPAQFRPGPDAGETLEIDDEAMIAALEKIHRAIARSRPHKGRLRLIILGASLVLIAALGLLWLPGALVRHTVSVVPDSKKHDIGMALLDHVTQLTGAACETPQGNAALAQLHARALGNGQSVVLPDFGRNTLYLPGGLLVLNRELVEDYDTPAITVGFMLTASQGPAPLENLLHRTGLRTTFRLLTTGNIRDDVLASYAQQLLTRPDPSPDMTALLGQFKDVEISATPYAYALDITGQTTLPLIQGDAYRDTPAAARRILPDGAWVSLQSICGG